jgi:hypothetical protein
MITTLRLKRQNSISIEFVIATLALVVGKGSYEPDIQDSCRWLIEPSENNWWARVEDGVMTVSGRYADDATMQAVKQMLLFRCASEVSDPQ